MKIKKTRLLQIIQEEIARIDEVEGETNLPTDEKELYDLWKAGDEAPKGSKKKRISDRAFTELYTKINPRIINTVRNKDFSTLDGRKPEDIAHDAFLNILTNPDKYRGGAALGTFLIGNAINDAIDSFRRARDYGGGSAGADVTTISDIEQGGERGGSAKLASLPSGSRTISQSPERAAISKQELEIIRKKLENAPEKDLQTLKYLTGVGADSAQELADELGLKRATSTGNTLQRFRLKYLKDNLEEGEDPPTGEENRADRMFNDYAAAESKYLAYLNNVYRQLYKDPRENGMKIKPMGKGFKNIEAANSAIEDLMNYEDAEYQGMPEDPNADLKKSNPYDHYEDLPKQEPMGPRNEAKSLEETIAAVVKETLGL